MSVLEMSHRSKPFEAIIQRAESDLRALLGLGQDHAVLFLQGGASLQFAMVPMNLRDGRRVRRLRAHRPLVEGRAQGGAEGRTRARRRLHRGDRLRPHPGARRARPRPRGRVPALHVEQHDLRHAVVDRPRAADRRAARVRRVLRRAQPADRRLALRPRLRRRAEEPRARRRHARRRPQGAARAHAGRPRRDARLPPAGREQVALQHAPDVRDLRRRPRAALAARDGRPRRGGAAQRGEGRARSTRRSTAAAASTAATRSRTAARA